MYPYHNQIKKRIANGELVDVQECKNYKNIGPCRLLIFSTEPFIRPIRPHRYEEYDRIIYSSYNEERGFLGYAGAVEIP